MKPPPNEQGGAAKLPPPHYAGKSSPQGAHSPADSQAPASGPYETKRNHAALFRNKHKTQPWQSDFCGAVVLESGEKFWVSITERTSRTNERYLSLALKPMEARP